MPLRGKAKAEYMRNYRTSYMRRYRARGKDVSRDPLVETLPIPGRDLVETSIPPGRDLKHIHSLIVDGNKIVGVEAVKPSEATEEVRPYDPRQTYNPGDKVLVQRGKKMIETVILELDADGQPIYE